ncbi:UBP1-associated protein 2B [Linum perenne]
MVTKRKLDSSRGIVSSGQSKKQQQQHQLQQQLQEKEEANMVKQDNENVEEVEEDGDELDGKGQRGEEDSNEEDPGENPVEGNNQISISSTSRSIPDDDDEEPLEKLLEPFSKDQLVNLLRDAGGIHRDVADRIRRIADEDPVHRKIFVHGLGWDTTAETLINAFKQYGEIEDCKAVTDKASGKSKGYGFILFKRRSGARKALREPQKKIGSRMTSCQLASMGPVQQPAQAAPVNQQVSEYTQRKIYVSNVGPELDIHKLARFFAKFGEIEEGPLGLDKMTGKPKGFCLFVYKSAESAKRALEEPHKNFEGHLLHCQKAIDGPKSRKVPQQRQHHQVHSSHYQKSDTAPYGGGAPSHLMAPTTVPALGFSHGAAAAHTLNPALGQALTALFSNQGAGLGLTNMLGTLGTASVNQGGLPASGIQSAYSNPTNISPAVMGYGIQGMQGGYGNQQMGQGGSGRVHQGQYGGVAPYMG